MRKELLYKESNEWTNDELIEVLTERYKESIIPPCRVCGKPLVMGAVGGGKPTSWYCGDAKTPEGKTDWKHHSDSIYEDRRQGGDDAVIELIKRFKASGVF